MIIPRLFDLPVTLSALEAFLWEAANILCSSPVDRTDRRVASDILGDAYEYLIKQFADATNRKAGEFYTPRSVVRLMVDILDPQGGETITIRRMARND